MNREKQNAITPTSIEKCLQYSEMPMALQSLIEKLTVTYQFTGPAKHFPDDTKPRVIAIVNMQRAGGVPIEFEFGLSLNDTEILVAELGGIKTDGKRKLNDPLGPTKDALRKDGWSHGAPALKKQIKEVNDGMLYSILACCRSEYDCPRSFRSFCKEFGYSDDSIKSKTIWERCLEQSDLLHRVFNEDEINALPS